jgi:hypothetical protein
MSPRDNERRSSSNSAAAWCSCPDGKEPGPRWLCQHVGLLLLTCLVVIVKPTERLTPLGSLALAPLFEEVGSPKVVVPVSKGMVQRVLCLLGHPG